MLNQDKTHLVLVPIFAWTVVCADSSHYLSEFRAGISLAPIPILFMTIKVRTRVAAN